MDGTVGEQKQDLVLVHTIGRHDVVLEFFQQRCEKSGASKLNLWKGLFVRFHNTLDTDNIGVRRVAIHCETMADLLKTKMAWDATETENREGSV